MADLCRPSAPAFDEFERECKAKRKEDKTQRETDVHSSRRIKKRTHVEISAWSEFDGEERIVRWNNLSGTYQAPDDLASQAGLPMDRFWAFRKTPKATRLPTKDVEGTHYAGEEVRVEAGEEKENMVKVMQGEKTIWLVRQRSAVEVLESLTERESAALLAAMQRVAGEHTR